MSGEPEEERVTEPGGDIEPPPGRPPTALGAGTHGPGEGPGREILVGESTPLAELARGMDVPSVVVLQAGFENLDRLLSVDEGLDFQETKALAARFGFRARRREGWE